MNKKTSFCWIFFFLTLNIINGSNSEFFSPPFSEGTAPPVPSASWSIWSAPFSFFPASAEDPPKPFEEGSPIPRTAEIETLLRIAGVDDGESAPSERATEAESREDVSSALEEPPLQEPAYTPPALPTPTTLIPPFPPCFFCPYFHHPAFICPQKHHYLVVQHQQWIRERQAFLEYQAILRHEEALQHEHMMMMMQKRIEDSKPYG